MPGFPTGSDGTIRQFSAEEIVAMELRTAGVKDGSHPMLEQDFRACTVRRDWFCKWDKLDDAICMILGGAAYYSGASGAGISRVMPMYFPGRPNYLAMGIENIRGAKSCGIDDTNTVPAYTHARFTVRHELVFFNTAEDGVEEHARYVEILPSTTDVNYLSMPGSIMQFRSSGGPGPLSPDGIPIPYPIGRPEAVTKMGRKWHRVPKSAWQTTGPLYKRVKGDPVTGERGYVGTVNKNTLFGMPPGTLLFMGVDEEVIPDPTVSVPGGLGDYAFSLTYWWLQRTTGGGLLGLEGFGHNYLFWGGTLAAGGALGTGYYLATKLAAWVANGNIADGKCLFDERPHEELYNVGA